MDERKKRLDICLALKSKIDENSIGYVKNHVKWKKEPGKLYFRFPSPFTLFKLAYLN
ncbi:MAG TPA: hypothetical protein H9885_00870 [Candidatus Jeotgalicoccus stercoravium]|nr:hypothetical protein [Candidatus Jeotgalicoccus stercoravium]